jgi:hypothetical protein
MSPDAAPFILCTTQLCRVEAIGGSGSRKGAERKTQSGAYRAAAAYGSSASHAARYRSAQRLASLTAAMAAAYCDAWRADLR